MGAEGGGEGRREEERGGESRGVEKVRGGE